MSRGGRTEKHLLRDGHDSLYDIRIELWGGHTVTHCLTRNVTRLYGNPRE